MGDAITPFRVDVPEPVLTDLRERLARTRFPGEIPDTGWDYGMPLGLLRDLVAYWRDEYDWRPHEAVLNGVPQFRTEIDGRGLHFWHVRSANDDAFPLVITHGWPGSVYEFHKIIGPLTDPAAHGGDPADSFHVVCPSMPGYGWSDPPQVRGFSPREVARTNAALMARLGYDRYGAQGGDWGAFVSAWSGLIDKEHVTGVHLNMVAAMPSPGDVQPEEADGIAAMQYFLEHETGYSSIHQSKPQTLGYGLTDSPAGLCAWIVEKFRAWSDCDGDVYNAFTKDELLTNVMIYWVTESICSSTRLYYERRAVESSSAMPSIGPMIERVEVPTGCAIFPKEIYRAPRSWAENAYNVTRWTRMERGGHFAALEAPDLLVDDIRAFFRTVR